MQLTKKTKLGYKNNGWIAIRGNKTRELSHNKTFLIALLAINQKGR